MHLRKYAQYRIMVQAHTRVGPGNYSSEPLNITTLEDGERDGALFGSTKQEFQGAFDYIQLSSHLFHLIMSLCVSSS